MNKLTNLKHYKKEHVKALYGKFGKSSNLNPGVMWPRKEELQYMKQYEEKFCPSLDDLLVDNMRRKEWLESRIDERKEFIRQGIKKLPLEMKQFFDKLEERRSERQKWLEEREALIEEVRDILGFRAKPSDDRFKEALAQKEAEEIKAKKKEARKKRENAGLDEILNQKLLPSQ